MGLTRVERWFSDKRKRLGRAFTGLILLGAMTATIQAGTFKLDLQACRVSADNGYHVESVPSVMPPYDDINMYFCNDDAYTQGNLFSWSELDMVPHHIIFSNTTGSDQNFTFKVGGDYKDTVDPDLVGWDYISELTLDENATRAIAIKDGKIPQDVVDQCRAIGGIATQTIEITANSKEIFRVVEVNGFSDDLTCVAIYNMRLAIGSSGYSGSSLQSRLISVEGDINLGDQTIPLPSVLATSLSKTMAATQAGSRTWTVTKSSSSSSVVFDDTCNDVLPLQQDVNITVTWTKGEVTPEGNVSITTVIQADNAANRDINISVVDTLYSGTTQTNQVGELICPTVTLTAGSGTQLICSHTFTVPDEGFEQYNDVAVATYIDPDANTTYPGYEAPTKTATATAHVQGTSQSSDENATIKDREWISGNGLSYSVATPTNGTLDAPYTAGTVTNGEVNWTSALATGSGSVTFTKTVYAPAATATTGTLSDIASLRTGGGSATNSGIYDISLVANAAVSLTITKTMDPADIPDGETLDFNFTVTNGQGYDENFTISVNETNTSQSLTISGLAPGSYGVSEHAKPGYAVDGSAVREVNLNLPTCGAEVVFTNIKAGRPGVEAIKVTYPNSYDGDDQNDSWEMTLYKWNGASWDPVESNLTASGTGLATLVAPGELEAGHYKIEETLKEGWYEVGRLGAGCDFNYTVDMNVSTYQCVFANAMYGTVIINKAFVQGSEAADFNFTQDINSSDPLVLGDVDLTKTYLNLEAGQYTVTETDPKLEGQSPAYDLTGLVCTESLGTSDGDGGTSTSLLNRRANIDLDPGEEIECTFTNRERGRISVLKTEDGNETTRMWTFTLEGPEGIIEHNTTSGLDFSDARLQPGETYTLCEIYVEAGWSAEWFLNSVNITDDVELRPHDGHTDRCYDFNVSAGETAAFEIDNISPAAGIHIEKSTNGQDADVAPGPVVLTGSTVTWKYVVTNTGEATLDNIVVTDNKEGTISCPKNILAPGESMECTETGTAVVGQYSNIGTVNADAYQGEIQVSDSDPSHYFAEAAAIDIEKSTNGQDADTPTGPIVVTGNTVTWTYTVKNTGDVTLTGIVVNDSEEGTISCPKNTLVPDENMVCTKTGIAGVGQYENNATATGNSPTGAGVGDSDLSHYFAEAPAIDIEKSTNGQDADDPTGPIVPVDSNVTWTYTVTNIGNVPLSNIVVSDNVEGTIICPQNSLVPGESMVCTLDGTAIAGQYENNATVTAVSPVGTQVSEGDPSHYLAETPSVDIEKSTNNLDADQAGEGPTLIVGETVTWKYIVTNTGDVSLAIDVVDDQIGVIEECSNIILEPGESKICQVEGIVTEGEYENTATVTGTSRLSERTATDSDMSHYTGIRGVELGDYVWYDDDYNGIQDENEDPVEGMTVTLLDENGTEVTDINGISSVETDENGLYHLFVRPGTYIVRFSPEDLPENYIFTKKNSGGESTDSDADPTTGESDPVTIVRESNYGVDAGIYCTCRDMVESSDDGSAMGTLSASLMLLMTLMTGLYFVRREEQYKRNRR